MVRRYVKYIVTLVGLALTTSAAITLHYAYTEAKTARLELQREMATAASGRISDFLGEIETELRLLLSVHVSQSDSAQWRREYVRLLRKVPAVSELRFLDRAGREQIRVSRLSRNAYGEGADYAADPRFARALKDGVYMSPVYFVGDSEPFMSLSVADRSSPGEVVAAEVNLKFIWDVVSAIKVGRSGKAYLVDSGGRLIAHPDISLVLKRTDLAGVPQVRERISPAADGERRTASITTSVTGTGDVLLASARVEPVGWFMFVEEPLREAISSLYGSLQRTVVVFVLSLLVGVVISVMLARRMAKPIRAIQHGAAQIGAGRLDHTIVVRTGDELEVLASEVNRMARKLQESYEGLERSVAERTAELTESLRQQTATSEVLKKIGRSSFDLDAVLDELLDSVVSIGHASAAGLFRKNLSGSFDLRAGRSASAQIQRFAEQMPISIGRSLDTASGRAIMSKSPIHIHDVRSEEGYRWPDAGFRTALAVPILRANDAIGVLVAVREAADPFTESQIALVSTFADQAGIAIENARLFDEIRQKSMELEKASQYKSEFLANVSHELRTPLNAVIGFSEALLERMFGELGEKQEEYLREIHESGMHLLSLINDVLNLSRIEAGKMELELSKFDIISTVQATMSLVRSIAKQNNVEIEARFEGRSQEITGDERKLKQILVNLLSNAVKFSHPGGTVKITSRVDEEGMSLAVADKGIGIDPKDLAHIFAPFWRVQSGVAREIEGTGLGLALSKRLVELHGGSIEVASTPGKGATFSIRIPRLKEAAN